MIALIVKEWRQLLSIAWLWLGLMALNLGATLLTERLDEQSYALWCSEYCSRGVNIGVVIMLIVLLLIVAYSLFPKEYDDSTIDFLHSLPVSKAHIFSAKFIAALSLVGGLAIFFYLIDAALLSVNDQSIDGKFYSNIHLSLLFRELLFYFIILAHGVFLSCFRLPGLLVYCAYLVGITFLESHSSDFSVFNVINVLFNRYSGQTLLYDWPTIGVQLAIAVVLLLISFFYWSRKENTGSRVTVRSSWSIALVWLGGIGAFLFVTLAMVQQVAISTGQVDSLGTFSREDDYYRFVFPAGSEQRADALLNHSSDDYLQLATLLNATEKPVIHADMTADNAHVPGIAKWKKIKMDLSGVYTDLEYRRILSHETTHVFQSVESGSALSKNFGITRFFIEGMAQYTSFIIVGDDSRRQSNWRLAAKAWERQGIRFDEMLNDAVFSSKYDPELYYSLGDVWTEALVQTCGVSALGDILRVVGRDNAPLDLPGRVFWRDTLQRIDCELEAVNASWRTMLNELIDGLPELAYPTLTSAEFSRNVKTGWVEATVELAGGDDLPERFSLRIRNEQAIKQNLDGQYLGKLRETSNGWQVVFQIPERLVPTQQFWYQLGYEPEPGSRYYFEPWQTGIL